MAEPHSDRFDISNIMSDTDTDRVERLAGDILARNAEDLAVFLQVLGSELVEIHFHQLWDASQLLRAREVLLKQALVRMCEVAGAKIMREDERFKPDVT